MNQQNNQNQPGRKMGMGETIGEISARLGYDVRDLWVAGYTNRQINDVLTGKYTLQELLEMEPEGGGLIPRFPRKGGARILAILLTLLFALLLITFCYTFYIGTFR